MKLAKNRPEDKTSDELSILVVEDNEGLRRLIQKRLERERFQVDAVGNGKDAIKQLMSKPEGSIILLLDYKLPDMNGRELIEFLNERGYIIPFVVITGHGDERIAVEMMKLGAKDYLVKDQSLLEVLPQVMGQISTQVLTEKKLSRVSKALQESEDRFRMLFNSGTDAIFVQEIEDNKPGNFIEVNDIACQRLGYTREELLEMSLKNIEIPIETIDVEFNPKDNLVKKQHRLYEAIQMTKHGIEICVENNSHLIDLEGKSAILCISRDITRRKTLEEQLRQAQKMEAIGKLAGGVAHDFNNLLTAIMGYSELILGKMKPDNPFREGIEEIKRAGKRAASLTQQLLAFSRKQVLKPKILNLNQVVRGMERMLERIIGEDIHLISQLDPRLSKIKADASQLEQIILNLTVNAVDAMPNGGTLTIKTANKVVKEQDSTLPDSRPGRFVNLSICDSGEGIDKKIFPQIFEPFFTTKTNGTGLGLSVVYGIVKQHNGWIQVLSEADKGSIFNIYFPALSANAKEDIEKEFSLMEFVGNSERILLVEDEAGVREISAKALRDYGYKVVEAVTAREAREIFKRKKGNFHLLISDIVLPDKSGIQLADDIRAIKPGMKVLLTSGYADQRAHLAEVLKKSFPFLQKPYSLVDLLKNVKQVLNAEIINRETEGP
ncbi:MAG: response regulator [Candidatus Aminicenantes bacterium]|nr:MAG: response regulator [Candidatus Aminicenantes bacterium]